MRSMSCGVACCRPVVAAAPEIMNVRTECRSIINEWLKSKERVGRTIVLCLTQAGSAP